MKTFLSLILIPVLAALTAAADDGIRADPDIFDGSRTAASAGGGLDRDSDSASAAAQEGEATSAQESGTEGAETEESESGGAEGLPGGEEDENASTVVESTEEDGSGQAMNGAERSARGGLDLGELPEVTEVRIGGTGGIDRPVEPERIEIPRIEMPRTTETGERRPETAQSERETARDDPQEPSDDASRVDRGDEQQPRNEPVRRVGEGSTVPTDF